MRRTIIFSKKSGMMQIIDFMTWFIKRYFIQEPNKRRVDKNKEAVQELIFFLPLHTYQYKNRLQTI